MLDVKGKNWMSRLKWSSFINNSDSKAHSNKYSKVYIQEKTKELAPTIGNPATGYSNLSVSRASLLYSTVHHGSLDESCVQYECWSLIYPSQAGPPSYPPSDLSLWKVVVVCKNKDLLTFDPNTEVAFYQQHLWWNHYRKYNIWLNTNDINLVFTMTPFK